VYEGRIIEQKDFGWNLRVGWLLSRARGNRPRLLDVGVGIQSSPADPWVFETDDTLFQAAGRDTWITLSFRFWDGL